MRIVYIASSPVPSIAANSVHVVRMCQAMADLGHEVFLFSPPDEAGSRIAHGGIFEFYGGKSNFVHKIMPSMQGGIWTRYLGPVLLRLMLKYYKPTVVYSRNLNAANVAVSAGFKVIFERHDVFSPENKGKIANFERLLRDHNHLKTIVISSALRDELLIRHKLDPRALFVAPDGADEVGQTSDIGPSTGTRGFNVGYAGHLYPGRGIEIIGEVARRLSHIDFSIVGGTDPDISFWQHRFSDVDNLKFLGHVAPKVVPSYLRSFDVLIAPYQRKVAVSGGGGDTSRWMSPLKIFEYMAAARPIVCSDLPALREVLEPGKDAVLVDPADIEGWITALSELKQNEEMRQKLSEHALLSLKSKFTWQIRAETILKNAYGQ
jgi:glycosyltransferase involved in cell wall biosynthesis